ncbi:MAG TPA: hypothetical protein VF389_01900, partial [Woeseiaceae bacterium]
RLVVGATRKTADEFFGCFSRELDSGATRVTGKAAVNAGATTRTWVVAAAIVVVLLLGWFLVVSGDN